jgi:uncharacterized membrane protein YraQ (UPF0718 family)
MNKGEAMSKIDATAVMPSPVWKSILRTKEFFDRIGWGVVSTVLVVLIVALFSPQRAFESVRATAGDLLFLSPYLGLAFAFSGFVKAASIDVLVTQVFRGRPFVMILAATAFGTLTPFCSCTVVPLIAVLLQSGTPLSAVMAFWISSPIISPDLFLYTAGILGIDVAVARFLAAAFMGVTAGLLTMLVEKLGGFKSPLRNSMVSRTLKAGEALSPHWRFWQEKERVAIFFAQTKSAAIKILPWIVLAFIIEHLMTAYVPTELVASWVGSNNAWAIPMAVLVSMPTYANPVAAVPLVKGLLALGMTKSAALAYLVAGSVTTIPAMLAVFPLVRTRIFLWHIGVGVAMSLVASFVFKFYLGE